MNVFEKKDIQIKISDGLRSLVASTSLYVCLCVQKEAAPKKQWVCRCVSPLESVPL